MNMRLVDPLGERFGPSPNDYPTMGEYLRALREHKGLTLADLAETTRIRKAYLQGIEEADRSAQPSRPFAIGYVRSYAQALGIDGDAAAARFKRENPDVEELFHDPVGVAHDKPKRSPLIIAVVALLLSGVVLWNVVQRTMVQEDRSTSALPVAAAETAGPPPGDTTVTIGAATPAPAAQNLPEPYKVPGLDAPAPEMKGGVPVTETASDADIPSAAPSAETPAAFKPQGAVYGAPAGPTTLVVLQARKPASLIVRGGGGAVYFARQLAVGEAYRAPEGQGLTAEVTDPSAFALYVAGENKGALVSQQTALDKLAVRPVASLAAGAATATSAATRASTIHRAPVRRPLTPEGAPYPTTTQEDPQADVAYFPRQPGR
jgi:cytoskeletal protein RodZ